MLGDMSKIYKAYVTEIIRDNDNSINFKLRVRVPTVHGINSKLGVADSDLPIAVPLIMPGSRMSRAKFEAVVNSVNMAYVFFDTGDFSKPVYFGLKTDTDLIDISALVKTDFIDFDLASPPEHLEGRLFYDKDVNFLSYYNENDQVTINIGNELLKPVINKTGVTIANGAVIYPTGVDSETGRFTVDLANARYRNKSFPVAVMTTTMLPDEPGYATIDGTVRGIDTSHLDPTKLVMLSESVPGAMTNDIPTDGSFAVVIGRVKKVGVTDGEIEVDRAFSESTVEVQKGVNGFPTDMRENTVMSINTDTPGSPRFIITPNATINNEFHFYVDAIKFEKPTSDYIDFANIFGEHYIYYDRDGVLQDLVNPTSDDVADIFINNCAVSFFFWDVETETPLVGIADERHGMIMDSVTHGYLHQAFGSRYIYGMTPGNVVPDGNGNSNDHIDFTVGQGSFLDEDLAHITAAKVLQGGLPILYLKGQAGVDLRLKQTIQANYAFKRFAGADDDTPDITNRLAYNYRDPATNTWSMAEVPTNDYVLYHLYASNSIHTGEGSKLFTIMGESSYETLVAAREGATTERNNLSTLIQFKEVIPIATFILLTKDAMTNDLSAAIMSTEDGDPYIDWRITSAEGGAVNLTSHTQLTDRDLANQHPATAISFDKTPLAVSWITGTDLQIVLEQLIDKVDSIDHDTLSWESRGKENAHPISAIAGLKEQLEVHTGEDEPVTLKYTWLKTINSNTVEGWSSVATNEVVSDGAVISISPSWDSIDPIRVIIIGSAWGEDIYQEYHNSGPFISGEALISASDTETVVVQFEFIFSTNSFEVTSFVNVGSGSTTSFTISSVEVYN